MASTPRPSIVTAKLSARAPVNVRLLSSKVIVAKIGREQASFAASTPARSSARSEKVSNAIISTPAFTPATITSRKISYASSKVSVPAGSIISPIGPISRATRALPFEARFAMYTASFITSETE